MLAFGLMVLIGGSNAVAVRFSNFELPPFWGAAIRFASTALIFWVILFVRKIELPTGRGLIGTAIFGLMSIGINYALLYWALLEVTAGFTMVMTSFVPLLTFLFAVAHRQEKFQLRGLLGAMIAIVGIVMAAGGGLWTDLPIRPILALIVAIIVLAYSPVFLKLFPPSHPVATNSISISTGALFLLATSLLFGEQWNLPSESNTWLSFIYLVVLGSVVLFYLYLLVLSRWVASATNYAFLLFPIVTVIMAGWLLGEQVTLQFALGGGIVLFGVWIGALSRSKRRPAPESQLVQEEATSSLD